jgi:shikimate dehydrogenase
MIINTTSLGMKGQPPLEMPWPDTLEGRIACDIVYSPLETPFLRESRARGAQPLDGLGMLLHQAALAFGLWFGTTPEVSPELRALVEADLQTPAAEARP